MKKIVETIANEIQTLAHALIDSQELGLRNSVRDKDVEVLVRSYENPIVIETVFNEYIDYIEQGREAMKGKQPNMDALRDWALANDIPTDNSTLSLISKAIWHNGSADRPLLATLEEEIDQRWQDEWADLIFDEIVKQLD